MMLAYGLSYASLAYILANLVSSGVNIWSIATELYYGLLYYGWRNFCKKFPITDVVVCISRKANDDDFPECLYVCLAMLLLCNVLLAISFALYLLHFKNLDNKKEMILLLNFVGYLCNLVACAVFAAKYEFSDKGVSHAVCSVITSGLMHMFSKYLKFPDFPE